LNQYVTWDDLGRPTTPGAYAHRERSIQVDQEQIVIWRADPEARLEVVPAQTLVHDGPQYILGRREDDPV